MLDVQTLVQARAEATIVQTSTWLANASPEREEGAKARAFNEPANLEIVPMLRLGGNNRAVHVAAGIVLQV